MSRILFIVAIALSMTACEKSQFSGSATKRTSETNDSNAKSPDLGKPEVPPTTETETITATVIDKPVVDVDVKQPETNPTVDTGVTKKEVPAKKENKIAENPPPQTDVIVKPPVDELVVDFNGGEKRFFYVVTKSGHIYYIVLNGNAVVKEESRHWTFKSGFSGGIRTYVTEGGLVFSLAGGHIYFVDPSTPDGTALDETLGGANHWRMSDIGSETRGCVVSYKRSNEQGIDSRYLGIGYGDQSSAPKFIELKLSDTAPFRPIWNTPGQELVRSKLDFPAPNPFGYSCYINQKNLTYFGAYYTSKTIAINLQDLTLLPSFKDRTSNPDRVIESPTQSPPYAISGDLDGNLFNLTRKNRYYTFSRDRDKPLVWASIYDSTSVEIFPLECMTTNPSCPATSIKAVKSPQAIGPISALAGGGIVGLTRSTKKSNPLVLELNDKEELLATKLDITIEGDPYMYTDFTGATLYRSQQGSAVFQLNQLASFKADKPLTELSLTWSTADGKPTPFEDLKLEARCYKETETKPELTEVSPVAASESTFTVTTPSCLGSVVNRLEIVISQMNNKETLSSVRRLKLKLKQ